MSKSRSDELYEALGGTNQSGVDSPETGNEPREHKPGWLTLIKEQVTNRRIGVFVIVLVVMILAAYVWNSINTVGDSSTPKLKTSLNKASVMASTAVAKAVSAAPAPVVPPTPAGVRQRPVVIDLRSCKQGDRIFPNPKNRNEFSVPDECIRYTY